MKLSEQVAQLEARVEALRSASPTSDGFDQAVAILTAQIGSQTDPIARDALREACKEVLKARERPRNPGSGELVFNANEVAFEVIKVPEIMRIEDLLDHIRMLRNPSAAGDYSSFPDGYLLALKFVEDFIEANRRR